MPLTQKGNSLILVLICGTVMGITLAILVKSVMTYKRTTELSYWAVKTQYIAESGLVLAPSVWESIPTYSFTTESNGDTVKQWIYGHLSSTYHPALPMDGDVYLIKSPNFLYSVGITHGQYRTIMKTNFVRTSDNQIKLHTWQKLKKES